ncbi:MAG: hypothetical protein M3Z04_14655 [Chloroflexota bacterium]|nr:hypothetical protein [Chloroflexota bacterium]
MSLSRSRATEVKQPAGRPALVSDPAADPSPLAGVFIGAAALLLALNAPFQWTFRPQQWATVGTSVLGIALIAGGYVRHARALSIAGGVLLLALIGLCLATQPVALGESIRTTWPLRLAVLLALGGVWLLLLDPPSWLRRALIAGAVPSGLGLALVGGLTLLPPAHAQQTTPANFAPYWLAVDHHGTLYATSATGSAVLKFDAAGRPQGTIWPAQAPTVGTPGPGIIPAGVGAIVTALNPNPQVTPTPGTGFVDPDADPARFWFNGLAVDAQDRLYLVDRRVAVSPSVLQLDHNGNVTARWPLPDDYPTALGCLTTDSRYVYLSSGMGEIFVFDYTGTLHKTLTLPYQPVGIAATGTNQLVALGSKFLNRIDVDTGDTITMTLPAPSGLLQTPYQAVVATSSAILVTDLGRNQVLVLDPQDGQVVQTIGKPGAWPGQFAGLAGLAQDTAGRIYVADDQYGVIQRFTAGGKIDAVWWAHEAVAPPPKR